MSDRSLKSKQRDQKQKAAAKAETAASAAAKQDANSRRQSPGDKGPKGVIVTSRVRNP